MNSEEEKATYYKYLYNKKWRIAIDASESTILEHLAEKKILLLLLLLLSDFCDY